MYRLSVALGFALLLSAAAGRSQQEITNDSVIQMSKAGLGDPLIIQSINANAQQICDVHQRHHRAEAGWCIGARDRGNGGEDWRLIRKTASGCAFYS